MLYRPAEIAGPSARQIFVKVDLLSTDNDNGKKKVAKRS